MDSLSIRPPEPSLPATYWNSLTQEDRAEFIKLRTQLHQSQKTSVKDRRLVSFSNEMTAILAFLERTEAGHEQRSILAGVAFAGPFICVNTRQLKSFLGRCKSSINGSFQQLGYVAVRTKSKARTCVLSIMPSLANEPNLLRQWTVRGASDEAHFCFISKFQPNPLPVITPDDLNDDRKPMQTVPAAAGARPPPVPYSNQVRVQQISNVLRNVQQHVQTTTANGQTKKREYDFDLSACQPGPPDVKIPEITSSYSLDYLAVGDSWTGQDDHNDWNPLFDRFSSAIVPRSGSAFFTPAGNEWSSITLDECSMFYDY